MGDFKFEISGKGGGVGTYGQATLTVKGSLSDLGSSIGAEMAKSPECGNIILNAVSVFLVVSGNLEQGKAAALLDTIIQVANRLAEQKKKFGERN